MKKLIACSALMVLLFAATAHAEDPNFHDIVALDPLFSGSGVKTSLLEEGELHELLESLGISLDSLPKTCWVQVGADGALSVFENGTAVPESRLRRAADSLTVLDDAGAEIASFPLASDGRLIAPAGSMVAITRMPEGARTGAKSIGIVLGSVDSAIAAQLQIEAGDAVLVTDVLDDMPAAKAGLQPYDIITHVNGEAPVTAERLREAIANTPDAGSVRLSVLRAGQPLEIDCGVAATPAWAGMATGSMSVATAMHGGLTADEAGAPIVQWNFDGAMPFGGEMDPEKALDFVKKLLEREDLAVFEAGSIPGLPLPLLQGQAPTSATAPAPLEARLTELEERLSRIEQSLERVANMLEAAGK